MNFSYQLCRGTSFPGRRYISLWLDTLQETVTMHRFRVRVGEDFLVPEEVLQRLHISPGEVVDLIVVDNIIVVRRVAEPGVSENRGEAGEGPHGGAVGELLRLREGELVGELEREAELVGRARGRA